MDSKK